MTNMPHVTEGAVIFPYNGMVATYVRDTFR